MGKVIAEALSGDGGLANKLFETTASCCTWGRGLRVRLGGAISRIWTVELRYLSRKI